MFINIFCVILFIIIGIIIFCNLVYNSNESIEQLSQEKIESVKYNSNTVVTGRTGKIFYVSQNGNDSNDGLSENTAWKTLSKVTTSFGARTITNGDTILFKRGDKFRGTITVNAHDILIGSYGDENKPKPQISVSPYNGATQGEWQEVKTNIWKYTVNGQDPFINDVGVIWCYSDSNNLSNTMQNLSGSFEYGQKITTNNNVDDSQLNLSDILKNDLEFYQFGHASARSATGGALYLCSTSNPKNRFSDIEFNISKHGIAFDGCTNLHVDNVTIKYTGNHGIGGGTVANHLI